MISLFLKVQKLLRRKLVKREVSIDINGAIISEKPKTLVKIAYRPKLTITPEKPTIEYLIKSSAFLKPSLGILNMNSIWSRRESFESPPTLGVNFIGISADLAPRHINSHKRED